jgi:predicted metal-dependent peptidase
MEVCMSKAKEMMTKARAGLLLSQPFFGSLALRLLLVEDEMKGTPEEARTAWVDGKSIHYYPPFIEGLSLAQLKGLVCHEVMHCANLHHTRRGDRTADRWNIATDYAINPIIIDCGMELPPNGLVDNAFRNMGAEHIYSELQEKMGEEDGDSGPDPGRCGGVKDAPGSGNNPGRQSSTSEKDEASQEWKIAVAQAATQAKSMGELPGSLERLISDILEPVLDWKELLRRFVDSTAKNDYQWTPPNRRFLYLGVVLPSLQSQELKNVTMVMDTSGSIGDNELRSFEAEARAIIQDYRANTRVIYCDSEVQRVEEFDADSPLELNPKGGGGTDFIPPFEYLQEIGECPVCLIYQTDGLCDSFPEEPSYPVLWVLTSKREFNPPFGEVIHL